MKRLLAFMVLLAGIARAGDPPPILQEGFQEPQAAVSPSGGVFVVAAKDGVIEVTTSSDGVSFGSPVRVGQVEQLMCGMRRGPRIAATSRSLVVTAIGAKDGDLVSWRSVDRGVTWKGPSRVNGKESSAREGLDGLAAGSKDEVAVVWLDDRNKGKEVWAATSADGGATWSENRVYSSPDGHVCECCHPSAAFTPKGELAVMWRNWLGGSRDFWLAVSKNMGKAWSKAEKLGEGTWKLDACPMDGGAIAAKPEGNGFATIWRRDDRVFFAFAGRAEQPLGAGRQGWLAAGKGGFYCVWLEGSNLQVLLPGGAPATLAADAGDPCVAGALDGKGPVVVTWASSRGVSARVLAPRK